MLCEQSQTLLFEFSSGELDAALYAEVSDHIDGCESCQSELAEVRESGAHLTFLAANWRDETPRAWSPPQMGKPAGNDFLDNLRLWFPTFASALALVMVTVVFVQQPASDGALPGGNAASADYAQLPPLPQATQAAMVQSVLEDSRDERGQEIQALLKILKAEMDKRSIETEESLRYIISHQIKGQQELDELYSQVEALMAEDTQPSQDGMPDRRMYEVSP